MKELNENELDQVSGGHRCYSLLGTAQKTKIGNNCLNPTESRSTCYKECFYYNTKEFGRPACMWKLHH